MHDVRRAARTMLERAQRKGLTVTNLKLQKLLYFAHGLLLAHRGKGLVNEQFQAWKYGPVLESLYHDLKVYGPDPIPSVDGFIGKWSPLPKEAKDEIAAIDAILAQFGSRSAGQLISSSHDPSGPWHAVYNANTFNAEIEDQAIKQYFESRIVRNRNATQGAAATA